MIFRETQHMARLAHVGPLATALAVLLSACRQDVSDIALPVPLEHENGLMLRVSNDQSAEPFPYGFTLRDRASVRNPMSMSVGLLQGSGAVPLPRKYLGLFGPRENLRTEQGVGSGGDEHHLVVWRAWGSCWIVMLASRQSKRNPNFALARAVLETATVRAGKPCAPSPG